jgi:hypothetical protein
MIPVETTILQVSWFSVFSVRLYLIANLEVFPAVEGDAAFSIFAHLVDIFLLVLERGERA